MTLEQVLETLTFDAYSDWRGHERRPRNLTAVYELRTEGEAKYFVPASRAQPTSGN